MCYRQSVLVCWVLVFFLSLFVFVEPEGHNNAWMNRQTERHSTLHRSSELAPLHFKLWSGIWWWFFSSLPSPINPVWICSTFCHSIDQKRMPSSSWHYSSCCYWGFFLFILRIYKHMYLMFACISKTLQYLLTFMQFCCCCCSEQRFCIGHCWKKNEGIWRVKERI